METREEMETQAHGRIQWARKRQMVQGLGLKRDRGCQLSELMDGPPGVLSTTGPAEWPSSSPRNQKPHLTGRKADAQRG